MIPTLLLFFGIAASTPLQSIRTAAEARRQHDVGLRELESLRQNLFRKDAELRDRREYDDAKRRLERAQAEHDQAGIEEWAPRVAYYKQLRPWTDTNTIVALEAAVTTIQTQVRAKADEIRLLDIRAACLDEVETHGRHFNTILTGMTIFVIICFFLLILFFEETRKAILVGWGPLVFLALFCMIVAVILFGQTGTLSGNQLTTALVSGFGGFAAGLLVPRKKKDASRTKAD
jgi:hypothetical protein